MATDPVSARAALAERLLMYVELWEADIQDEEEWRAIKGGPDDNDTPMPHRRQFKAEIEDAAKEMREAVALLRAPAAGGCINCGVPVTGERITQWVHDEEGDEAVGPFCVSCMELIRALSFGRPI